jgi:glycine/D-amino acid oxidase-like deaminating enzyme
MMGRRQVVVVGAGVLGLFTAWELVRDGHCDVIVIEKSHPGGGSSGRSVGMVETQYITRPRIEVLTWGREIYTQLELDHGLHFVHGGYLRLARTREVGAMFAQSIAFQREFEIDDAEILTRDEVAARWPQLVTDDLEGGLLGTWDGYVDGYEVTQLLTKLIRDAGARVSVRSALLGASRRNGCWQLETETGVLKADIIVNAAGPWAGLVGEMLGAPVPLLPQLHGAVTVKLAQQQPMMPFVMDYVPGSGTDGVYFRSENPTHLIAGLHTDDALGTVVTPDIPLGELSPAIVERIVALLSERLRGAGELRLGRTWTGIYPMTPDHEPIVGRHPMVESVVCALGAGGNGIQLSPAIGRLGADAVLGAAMDRFTCAAAWSPDRLSGGHALVPVNKDTQ